MGRPARIVDLELARTIEGLVSSAGSVRRVAMLLDLDPATLSRSLVISAFARTTRLKIMANLEAATLAVAAGRPKSSSGRKLENSDTLLHILQKLYTLLQDEIGRAHV